MPLIELNKYTNIKVLSYLDLYIFYFNFSFLEYILGYVIYYMLARFCIGLSKKINITTTKMMMKIKVGLRV